MLDHAAIAARIPHQGSMCLLASVVDWSETRIACRAASHADPDNPLRAEGRLGAAIGPRAPPGEISWRGGELS